MLDYNISPVRQLTDGAVYVFEIRCFPDILMEREDRSARMHYNGVELF
ncbi:MAG: hypothetical protein Q8907_12060 [Bacteroidota bacterium]|nr:hypothetical protein [Bacteroidota bacterium]